MSLKLPDSSYCQWPGKWNYQIPVLRCAVSLASCIFIIAGQSAYAGSAPGIRVQGNRIVTTSAGTLGVRNVRAGVPIVLRGVNLSGAEYACLEKHSFWDKPQGSQATINAMLTWHANVIRLPLNEDCWLGINGAPARYSGSNYIHAISSFVRLANRSGLVVEVDLHYGAGGMRVPTSDDYPAPDADHAPAFWRSVAKTFKDDHAVIFNLINEPYGISWHCLRDGGCTAQSKHTGSWRVVGSQSLVNTVRAACATNPIIIAGLDWSDDLTQWLYYAPHDSAKQLIAGFHTYKPPLDTWCTTAGCWNRTLAPIQAAGYPVIIDEFGEEDCAHGYIDKVMEWADAQTPKVGYWAWAWTVASCRHEPSLITNPLGDPTPYGAGVKNHLLSAQ
jgi:endoglucanase